MIITKTAFPRGALVGNPSDGYFGKTIALCFTNFRAEVILYESPELEILPDVRDHSVFESMDALVDDVRMFGYYGGVRLLKAAVKRFDEYCRFNNIDIHRRNFTIRYHSDIPHLVGLAGSSAIIAACMRALMEFYGVDIPKPALSNMVLSVETEELNIQAGLQDRVAQVYQGVVHMDFAKALMEKQGYGRYEHIDPALLPLLYIGYQRDLSEISERVHSRLAERFRNNDPDVLEAVRFWADLTDEVRGRIERGEGGGIGELLNANFDRRASICAISDGNMQMIEAARSTGASAKFTGSGGAIIGVYEDEDMFAALCRKLVPLQVGVIKPVLAPAAVGE